jgi:hypothetical protein
MNGFTLCFRTNGLNNGQDNNDQENNEVNVPENAIQVTGFTGEYEKYNGIYLQKEISGYDPDYGYPYFYEHENGTSNLTWNVGFSYWTFMSIPEYIELAWSVGGIIGDAAKHPSNYSYQINSTINSGNPAVK